MSKIQMESECSTIQEGVLTDHFENTHHDLVNAEVTTNERHLGKQIFSEDENEFVEDIVNMRLNGFQPDEKTILLKDKVDKLHERVKNGEDVTAEINELRKELEREKVKDAMKLAKNKPLMDKVEAITLLDNLNEKMGCKALTAHTKNDVTNSFLKDMLSDQMVVAHKHGMTLLANFDKYASMGELTPTLMKDLISLSTRLMEVSQKAALTLHKIRFGGKQTVVVKHQNVQVTGGQAVIANEITKEEGGDDE